MNVRNAAMISDIITPTDDFYGAGVDKVEVKIKTTPAISRKLFGRLSLHAN